MNGGLNLFSIKDHIQTEEDLLQTCLKLKEQGYSYLQYSGAPFDADRIKRVSDATGMPFVLTHVPFDRILNDTEALMEEHARFGCHNIGLGGIPYHLVNEWDQCLEAIEKMNAAGEKMEKAGFRFFYHNHQKEFIKVDGKTYFDRLIEAPYINFTLDTYWVQNGGVDIMELLPRLKGRINCVHLKDYTVGLSPKTPEITKVDAIFAPVGDGNLNFKKITAAMKEAGTEYFLVEQDDANFYSDPFEQVGRSIKYITEEL